MEITWKGSIIEIYPAGILARAGNWPAHPHGTSIIASGPHKGLTLPELIEKNPELILGKKIRYESQQAFPLLIKFIDANDRLSVQVHPDNAYARRVENEYGKTEMWYILEAKAGAKLIYGLKEGTTESTLARAIENSQLELYLNEIEVKKGDIFFIPAGTVHAIGEGILLAESNKTLILPTAFMTGIEREKMEQAENSI